MSDIARRAQSASSEESGAISIETDIATLHGRGLRGKGIRIGHLDTPVADIPTLNTRITERRHFAYDGLSSDTDGPSGGAQHGTQMAGLLVASAPDAQILTGAVLERGAVLARLLLGLDWLIQASPDVICLPLGIPPPAPILRPLIQACIARDIVVVAAIGNLGPGHEMAPAILDGVLAIGASPKPATRASARDGSLSASDRDPPRPHLMTSGDSLLTLAADGQPVRARGASAATAITAGIVALLRERVPHADAARVTESLCVTARSEEGQQCGTATLAPVAAFEWLHDQPAAANPAPTERGCAEWDMHQIDPHLLSTLAKTPSNKNVTFVLHTRDDPRHAFDFKPESGERVCRLTSAPVFILKCSAAKVRMLLDTASYYCASAADVDRSFYIPTRSAIPS